MPTRPQFIDKYIASHTGKLRHEEEKERTNVDSSKLPEKNDGPFGTKRKSSEATAFKWASTMKASWINKVETECEKPMLKLGYRKFGQNEQDSFLTKSAAEIWPYTRSQM